MDRNQVIGFLLMGALFIGYMFYNQPTREELERKKRTQDSIAALQIDTSETINSEIVEEAKTSEIKPAVEASDSLTILKDSLKRIQQVNLLGNFANAAEGKNQAFTLENEKLKITLHSLGGRVASVELKEYQTHDSLPLLVFDADSSDFSINFFQDKKSIRTNELFFIPVSKSQQVSGEEVASFTMRLPTDEKDKYIDFIYNLSGNSYELSYTIKAVGLEDMIEDNSRELGLHWSVHALSKEKNIETERSTTTIFFKYFEDEVDYISERNSERIPLVAKTRWVAFKQQYFSAAIINDSGFDKIDADVETRDLVDISSKYTKYMAANLTVPFSLEEKNKATMRFYFGPNHYQTLKSLDIDLQDQIDLGWGIFGWVNEYLVIPVFNFLDGFNLNYGIIILLLTLFIKLILFPFTYKTYMSSAKMKVLKPEIDELNEKHKNDDPLKKQQATMALYRKAGVNPLAGCLPMLFQMPILYAMFRFFPASIELRQEPFLWATDLSTYDSIYDLGFSIPFYGDHISLFTLLMAASTFLYTKYNTQMSMSSGPQAQQMKIMMYFMPVMLLGFFNNYSAGLSYYYFLANIVSVAQQLIIKTWFVDEEAILKQIELNKKKPQSGKKSAFQKRLEDMAKKRGYNPNTKK